MNDGTVTTENILQWLDQVRAMLPGTHPHQLAVQFEKVKQHVVALENDKRMAFTFSTTEELFEEISNRYTHTILISAMRPEQGGDERYFKLHSGDTSACIGLATIAKDLMRSKIFRIDPNELQGGAVL